VFLTASVGPGRHLHLKAGVSATVEAAEPGRVTTADRQIGARCAGLASSLFGRAEELGDRVRDEVGCLQRKEVTPTFDNAQADGRGSLEGLSRLVGL
jgi:hypothetical protein